MKKSLFKLLRKLCRSYPLQFDDVPDWYIYWVAIPFATLFIVTLGTVCAAPLMLLMCKYWIVKILVIPLYVFLYPCWVCLSYWSNRY